MNEYSVRLQTPACILVIMKHDSNKQCALFVKLITCKDRFAICAITVSRISKKNQ